MQSHTPEWQGPVYGAYAEMLCSEAGISAGVRGPTMMSTMSMRWPYEAFPLGLQSMPMGDAWISAGKVEARSVTQGRFQCFHYRPGGVELFMWGRPTHGQSRFLEPNSAS